jgi:hypothetical protein
VSECVCGIVTEGSYGLSLVWVVKWSGLLSYQVVLSDVWRVILVQ